MPRIRSPVRLLVLDSGLLRELLSLICQVSGFYREQNQKAIE